MAAVGAKRVTVVKVYNINSNSGGGNLILILCLCLYGRVIFVPHMVRAEQCTHRRT